MRQNPQRRASPQIRPNQALKKAKRVLVHACSGALTARHVGLVRSKAVGAGEKTPHLFSAVFSWSGCAGHDAAVSDERFGFAVTETLWACVEVRGCGRNGV